MARRQRVVSEPSQLHHARIMSDDLELFQFRYSHFNEKVRWALDHKALSHRRTDLLPGPHASTIKKMTGQTQTPVLPHSLVTGQRLCGSAELSATLPQVPLPLAAHDWQVPQLEVVQQTPSVQLALEHSLAALQAAPFAFLATQVPAAEVLPVQ